MLNLLVENLTHIFAFRFGGTEGATFCTLTTICNQLDSEAHLDIYLYAKLYHDHRPGIWPSFVRT